VASNKHSDKSVISSSVVEQLDDRNSFDDIQSDELSEELSDIPE
jgi:preprotein translocase subunit SecG